MRELKYLENLLNATLSIKNPTWTALRFKVGPVVNNHLSYGMAYVIILYKITHMNK